MCDPLTKAYGGSGPSGSAHHSLGQDWTDADRLWRAPCVRHPSRKVMGHSKHTPPSVWPSSSTNCAPYLLGGVSTTIFWFSYTLYFYQPCDSRHTTHGSYWGAQTLRSQHYRRAAAKMLLLLCLKLHVPPKELHNVHFRPQLPPFMAPLLLEPRREPADLW